MARCINTLMWWMLFLGMFCLYIASKHNIDFPIMLVFGIQITIFNICMTADMLIDEELMKKQKIIDCLNFIMKREGFQYEFKITNRWYVKI